MEITTAASQRWLKELWSDLPLFIVGSVLQHEVQIGLLNLGQAQLNSLKQSGIAVTEATIAS